jgi:hypothetical protein
VGQAFPALLAPPNLRVVPPALGVLLVQEFRRFPADRVDQLIPEVPMDPQGLNDTEMICTLDFHLPGGPTGHRIQPASMPSNKATTPATPGSPGVPNWPGSEILL